MLMVVRGPNLSPNMNDDQYKNVKDAWTTWTDVRDMRLADCKGYFTAQHHSDPLALVRLRTGRSRFLNAAPPPPTSVKVLL